MKVNDSIARSMLKNMLFVVVFTFIISAIIAVSNTYRNYNYESINLREDYIYRQKSILKSEVEKIAFHITHVQKKCDKYKKQVDVEQLKEEIINDIVSQRFGSDGYFFGSTFSGDPLFSNGKITIGTDNIWNLTDPNGVKLIQLQREASKNPKGGFYEYQWRKLNDEKLSNKLSFTLAVEDWQWMIGAGVYVDDIENVIEQKKLLLEKELKFNILKIGLLFVILIAFLTIISKHFSSKLHKSFDAFMHFFDKLNKEMVPIGLENLHFPEFATLATKANHMVELRKQAETKLIESEKQYRFLAENSKDMIYRMTLPQGIYEYVSPASARIFGYTPEEFQNSPLLIKEAIHPDWSEYFVEQWDLILKDKTPDTYEYQIVHGNSKETRWINQRNTIIRNAEGKPIAIQGIVTDVTKQKLAEKQIKRDLEEKTVLLHEIYHRTKNNMQVISSMMRLQARRAEELKEIDEIGITYIKNIFQDIAGRINAMSLVHKKLYEAKDLSRINLREYIQDLTRLVSRGYSLKASKIKFEFELQDVYIMLDSAVPLGLVLNELLTNIFKHAFPDNQAGRIIIRMNKDEDAIINIFVEDTGVGVSMDFHVDKVKSMGIQTVTSLIRHQLKGRLRIDKESGMKWHFQFRDDKHERRV